MSRRAKELTFITEERLELDRLLQTHTIPKRMTERAQIVLLAAEGLSNTEIGHKLRTCESRVCKWRTRFIREGLEGLLDEPRSGQPQQ